MRINPTPADSLIATHNVLQDRHLATELTDWLGDNTAVTRIMSFSYIELQHLLTAGAGHNWSLDTVNRWIDANAATNYYLGIHLPDGVIVTAFGVTAQEVSSDIEFRLERSAHATGITENMGTVGANGTMSETTDTIIERATIDNDTYAYYILVLIATGGTESRIRGIKIDYTVVRPQP